MRFNQGCLFRIYRGQVGGDLIKLGYLRVLYGAVGTVAGVMLDVALLSECGECRVRNCNSSERTAAETGAFWRFEISRQVQRDREEDSWRLVEHVLVLKCDICWYVREVLPAWIQSRTPPEELFGPNPLHRLLACSLMLTTKKERHVHDCPNARGKNDRPFGPYCGEVSRHRHLHDSIEVQTRSPYPVPQRRW